MAEPHPASIAVAAFRAGPQVSDAMVVTLTRMTPSSDAEAFAVLRRAYPASALCERVAAIGRWRAG